MVRKSLQINSDSQWVILLYLVNKQQITGSKYINILYAGKYITGVK